VLNNTSLEVSVPTDEIDYSMSVFVRIDSSANGFTWVPVNTNDSMGFNNSDFPYSYLFSIATLGWINCDYFYYDPNPKYDLKVNFSNRPSEVAVYLVFNQINSVARLYDWNLDGTFEDFQIPEGHSITIVAVGVDAEGKYYLSTEDVVVNSNMTATLSMAEVTKDYMKSVLDNL
jgi:hypothetical protein